MRGRERECRRRRTKGEKEADKACRYRFATSTIPLYGEAGAADTLQHSLYAARADPISFAGTVEFREDERLEFTYLIRAKHVGEPVHLRLLRDGQVGRGTGVGGGLTQLVGAPAPAAGRTGGRRGGGGAGPRGRPKLRLHGAAHGLRDGQVGRGGSEDAKVHAQVACIPCQLVLPYGYTRACKCAQPVGYSTLRHWRAALGPMAACCEALYSYDRRSPGLSVVSSFHKK